jgi:hypothetical protein
VQYRFAGVYGSNGLDYLSAAGALEEIASGAGVEEAQYVAVIVIPAQDEYGSPRVELLDLPRRFDARKTGHHYVHEHDVRLGGPDHGYGLQAVGCLPDELNVGLLFEETAHALAQNQMIIGYHDPDTFHSPATRCVVPAFTSIIHAGVAGVWNLGTSTIG